MSLLREAERCVANQSSCSSLNALISSWHQSCQWLDRVNKADSRRAQGRPKSRLDGRLVAIKDNICTRDLPTTCASRVLDSFISPFNATVVQQLEDAGAIVAGKANLDEFGMGSHSVNSYFGPVKNMYCGRDAEDFSAGGSSGGSAVAVATEQCYTALGTDTGGSVRLPAAYTGLVGFKPSYGLISRWGVVAYANSLDTVGIFGRKVSGVRDVFDILNQHDPRDPTSLSLDSRSRIDAQLNSACLASRMKTNSLKIGVPVEYNISELDPTVRRAWSRSLNYMLHQGHSIHRVSLPTTKLALSAYYVLAPAEASSNLAKFDGVRFGTSLDGDNSDSQIAGYLYAQTRGQGFGPEVKRRILLGTFSLSASAIDNYFIQAQRIRRLVQQDFNAVFLADHPLMPYRVNDAALKPTSNQAQVDVLICPTAPSPPPVLSTLGSGSASYSPLHAYTNDVFTVPASLAGLPAASVPVTVGSSESLAGVQIIGQYGDDALVLRVAEMLSGKRL
ncbi:glutamyl-tRNA(Gln) amidotransferase subunit HER2 [Aspergillus saccharolyticus JOP 1030-1]|uniref:Glutamyl-tRNA(Gln) amidotransferase subunit A, mitochondrial n=1 Tax=Aspergillus saccharolyticus JOP 1030-1 TaxID=1450539 RepID=A0A319ACN2_9EURO|nr:A subunit of putative glutamyl-tRNA amidotransferase [Aspergillus saccharolyticus JOP 1030-1]PYH44642.1 A subunit of putative glutamyl-tRNA amidotransferase [Aspergillus saccharolyticus JOP 1030-1]